MAQMKMHFTKFTASWTRGRTGAGHHRTNIYTVNEAFLSFSGGVGANMRLFTLAYYHMAVLFNAGQWACDSGDMLLVCANNHALLLLLSLFFTLHGSKPQDDSIPFFPLCILVALQVDLGR